MPQNAGDEPVLATVALDVLGGAEADDGLAHGQPDGVHRALLAQPIAAKVSSPLHAASIMVGRVESMTIGRSASPAAVTPAGPADRPVGRAGTPPTPTSPRASIRSIAPALGRLPEGDVVLRGLPFSLGTPVGRAALDPRRRDASASTCADARPRSGRAAEPPGRRPFRRQLARSERRAARRHARRLGPAHRRAAGPLRARLRRTGAVRAIEVRRRFEIADGIIGWGFLPFEAVGHRADEVDRLARPVRRARSPAARARRPCRAR